MTLTNLRTGATFTGSGKVPSAAQSSAEWIAEAPYSGGVLPLGNFGSVLFGSDYTQQPNTCFLTIGGTTGPIGLAAFNQNLDAITMETSKGIMEATPSPISDGTSFSIARMNPVL